jgi:CHAT domain-containing protein/tetratricopeptide (TPR) repeat protein
MMLCSCAALLCMSLAAYAPIEVASAAQDMPASERAGNQAAVAADGSKTLAAAQQEFQQGQEMQQREQYAEAATHFAAAAAGYRRAARMTDAGAALRQQGECLWTLQQYRDAASVFGDATRAFEDAADAENAAWMSNYQGNCLRKAQDNDGAVHAYRDALRRFSALGDSGRKGMKVSAQRLADVLDDMQHYNEAAEAYEQLASATAALDGPQQWEAISARVYAGNARLRATLNPEQLRVLAAAEARETEYNALCDEGKYGEAVPVMQAASQTLGHILGEKHSEYATSLHNLGFLYESLSQYAQAESYYQQALDIRRSIYGEKHPSYAETLHNLGVLYRSTGDYAQAEALLAQAVSILRESLGKRHRFYSTSLSNLAGVYNDMGDVMSAEPLMQESLECTEEISGDRSAAYANRLNDLALLYASTGDHGKAEMRYCQALNIYGEVLGKSHPDYATTLDNLALLYFSMGEYERAEPLYRQALDIVRHNYGSQHPLYAICLDNLALVHIAKAEYGNAETLLRESLVIREHTLGLQHLDYASSLSNLASWCETTGDWVQANTLLLQALGVVNRNLELAAVAQSQRQQVTMTSSLRHILDAYLTLAMRHEELHASAYEQVLSWKGIVLMRQRAMRAARQPELAATFEELQNATSELAALALSTPALEQAEQWQRQVSDLSARREQLEARLSAVSRVYREATRPVTFAQVQAALPEHGALVDFLEYNYHEAHRDPPDDYRWERRCAAFVFFRAGPPRLLDLGPALEISQAIDAWRQTLDGTGGEDAVGRRLRAMVWEPIEAELAKPNEGVPIQLVLVSPDGALGRLPLGALPGREADRYLLEDWAIATVPTARMLPLLLTQNTAAASETCKMLALGDVDYDHAAPAPAVVCERNPPGERRYGFAVRDAQDPSFLPLSGTRDELAMIQRLAQQRLGGEGLTVLNREGATEVAVRRELPQHRYAHLATHGFFAASRFRSAMSRDIAHSRADMMSTVQSVAGYHPDLLSGLVLAGANCPNPVSGDGILTAAEVSALDLSETQLITLSACETGLGEQAGGEGLLGLQRAFQVAGARTVVASLWKVPDQATRDLMERFYSNLLENRMGTLAALREAQRWMLRERSATGSGNRRGLEFSDSPAGEDAPFRRAPLYWAAFVLSGDWR